MLLAGVILILVIFALIGWRKGVIRLVLSLVSMIITIMAAVVIAPLATTAIKNNTNIDENIAQSIYTVLYENKEVDEYFEDKQVLTGGIDISQVESHIQTVTDVVAEVGDKINLPESLTEAVKAMPDSELMSVIREYGEASVKEITIRLIAFRLADIVLTATAYLVIMVVVSIVLRVVVAATGLIRRLPVIKQADKLGGLIVGLVEGIAVVWIFFTVVTAISGTQAASNILVQIHGNAILESLYNCNPITSLLFSTIRSEERRVGKECRYRWSTYN